ncbi:MAG: metallophosphoesterase, partial [Kiritimatiellae bacterium]|nr:metallophosphoesterase [Kiritimatiellia bacterium]
MNEQKSQGMAQTRRAFIGQGAFAFLAAAGMGHRAFGATGPARLRFGALSDIHITRGKGSCDIFEKALAYFRDQKVDAVLIAGDMADSGLDSQLRRVG